MSEREKHFEIVRIQNNQRSSCDDSVAVEEPLEIRIVFGKPDLRKTRTLSVTMRTPGDDFELASGFLVSEGIASKPEHVVGHRFVGPAIESENGQTNVVEIELHPDLEFEFSKLQRHFYTTSSCGVCGKASLDAIRADDVQRIQSSTTVSPSVICGLPLLLRNRQDVFERTGGLHAAGLVDEEGDLISLREDVGRHNAVDKLIGGQLLTGNFPLECKILVLSGRASFELLQKALLAAIPVIVAVGAPSSLAVELAREFDMTLVGFTSQHRFNVYSGEKRIVGAD